MWIRVEFGLPDPLTASDGTNPRSLSLDGEDIQTGHPAFDYRARIFGKPEEAVALLDPTTRDLVLRDVVDEGARVDGGKVTLVHLGVSGVPDLVRRLVALGKSLSMSPSEVPGRLARNAAEDSLSSVRLRNLTLLQERFPALAEAREASRAALASDQPNLRLAGARFLGAEGLDAAEALALSGEVEADLRRQALQLFFRHADAGRAVTVLERLAAAPPPPELLPARVEAAGQLRHVPTLERLLAQADGLGDAEAGRLSLAVPAGDAGALSLAGGEEAPGGELSLPSREPDGNV